MLNWYSTRPWLLSLPMNPWLIFGHFATGTTSERWLLETEILCGRINRRGSGD